MTKSNAYDIFDRLYRLQLLFWNNPTRQFRTKELADEFGVSEDVMKKDLDKLSIDGRLPITKDSTQFWHLMADAKFELLPIKMNLEEAVALYLAGRLLSQIHDEHNEYILLALRKLIAVTPSAIASHQRAMLAMSQERQEKQPDKSDIFKALSYGWALRRVVHLRYAPPRGKPFSCNFRPYLLEPSAIGRTFYAIGYSDLVNDYRTYKFERIEDAKLTGETFPVDEKFDGPALIRRSWGVMYGDEQPVTIHLHFSHYVTKRVKETVWHPTQHIDDASDGGCDMQVQIGDMLEIKNWIRGWGSDCEVKGPELLRQEMIKEARRLAHMYGVGVQPASSDEPDKGLLSKVFRR